MPPCRWWRCCCGSLGGRWLLWWPSVASRLVGLRRIGIDEISYRKGQRYLLVVVDHDNGRLMWASKDRNAATLRRFFDDLGAERAAALTHVSADGAEWIHTVVTARAPRAVLCLDTFQMVAWATMALDAVRRRLTVQLRRDGQHETAATLKNTRWALLKNPLNQSGDQRTTVTSIARTNKPLYTAYLLKEQLRAIFETKGEQGRALLAGWISWARRCRIPEFVKLADTITRYRTLILNTLDHAMSNARVGATNTHLRLLTRHAYGYHSPDSLISMADLTRGGLCPATPRTIITNHPKKHQQNHKNDRASKIGSLRPARIASELLPKVGIRLGYSISKAIPPGSHHWRGDIYIYMLIRFYYCLNHFGSRSWEHLSEVSP